MLELIWRYRKHVCVCKHVLLPYISCMLKKVPFVFFLLSMYLVLWFWIENFGLHNILVEKGSPRCYFYRLALGK